MLLAAQYAWAIPREWPRPTLTLFKQWFNYHLTLLRVSDLAYPVTLLRDGRGLEFYKGHSPLVPDRHR